MNIAEEGKAARVLEKYLPLGDLDEKERSLLVSLIIDFLLFLPDVVAAVLAHSITMLADALKCASELLATLFSWLAYRKIARGRAAYYDYGYGKLENLTGIIVAVVMLVCLGIVLVGALHRLSAPMALHIGGARLGVILMFGGVCTNTWLWAKNYRIARKEHSPIMDSQWRLFRAKAFADAVVFMALLSSLAFKHHSWSFYIDPLASFVVAGFLLFSIYGVVSHSVYDLLDKTLDESVQLIIINRLAAYFDDYKEFHGVRSRRSGNNVFIEIFLEFDGELKMSQAQGIINNMKTDIEKRITNSSVSIVPSVSKVAAS